MQRALKLSHRESCTGLAQLSCSFPLLPFPFQDCKKCATLLIPVVPWAKVGICSSLQCSKEHKMTSINFMLFLSPSPICSSSRALPPIQAQCLSPPAAVGWGCPWIRISFTLTCIYAGCLRSPCKLGYSQASPQQTWPPGSGCLRTLLPMANTYCSVGSVGAQRAWVRA